MLQTVVMPTLSPDRCYLRLSLEPADCVTGFATRHDFKRIPAAQPMRHPCLSCGACCAIYRVGLHWSEAEPALGGLVPRALTEPLRRHELVMRGTSHANARCIALDADIGRYSRCSIHPLRPSACREVGASWEHGGVSAQCDRARIAHGLLLLTPTDWIEVGETALDPPQAA